MAVRWRSVLLAATLLGAAHWLNIPLLNRILPALARATYVAASVLLALVAPRRPDRAPLSPLHAAMVNVTTDAGRAADLIHEFLVLEADPALQQRFMAFLALKASTSYSRVEQQLSWVLWVYSTLWMPLLIVLCLSRASRRGDRASAGAGAAARRGLPQGRPVGRGEESSALAKAGDWAALQHAESMPVRRMPSNAELSSCPGPGPVIRRSATVGAGPLRRALSSKGSAGSVGAAAPLLSDSSRGGICDVDVDAVPLDQAQRSQAAVVKAAGYAGLRPVAELR